MSDCCNKSCGCRTVITKQGERGLQGPVGPAGLQGPQGIQGVQGDPGPAGTPGTTYEYFAAAETDFGWTTGVENAITGVTRTIAGADGKYQVHANINSNIISLSAAGGVAYLRLYVNGVLVQQKPVTIPNETDGRKVRDVSLLWRGDILNGQDVEVRCISVAEHTITTVNYEFLINREG